MDFRDELSGVLIEDIEDLVAEYTGDQRNNRKYVVPKVKRKKEQRSKEADKYQPPVCDSIIPGTQRIFLKTWGCSHNNSDSEYMAGQLAGFGYILTDDKTEADLWLLNSCTVKNPSEDHFRNDVVEAKKRNKHIVLAGCVPQGQPKSSYLEGLSIVGVQQIDRIVEVVEETLKGYTVRLLGTKKDKGKKVGGAPLSMPKVRKNPLIEIIAINTGCLNQCTYCKTKHARGELGSYNVSDIVDRASEAFAEGVVELWLTSEDLGAYGKDIDTSLPELLWAVLEVVPPGCRVRLGMTNPPYILEHMEEISKILRHPSVYSFIHIPVQSASDSVLYDMRREYCLEDFEELVNFLKSRVPDITIATDVICGFPTETEKDFQQTLELIERHHFPSLFINQFFPRPATPAAKLPRLDAAEVKGRTKRVSELFNSYTTYDHKVGETQHVLVTDLSSDKRFYVAHNQSYDQVLVPKNGAWMGHLLEVKITATGKHYLECEVIKVEHLNRLPEYPLLHPPKEIDEIILSQDTKKTPSWRISIADVAKVTSFVLISFFLLKSRFAPKLFQKVFH